MESALNFRTIKKFYRTAIIYFARAPRRDTIPARHRNRRLWWHYGGDTAAWIAQKNITEFIEQYSSEYNSDALKLALIHANNCIIEAQHTPALSNMCCVATAVIIDKIDGKVYMAHVGDTRLYEYNDDKSLTKRTHDHSLIGQKEERGN